MTYTRLALNGAEYHLIYNGEAKFEIEELTDGDELFMRLSPTDREGFELLLRAVEIMSQQAEACRRYENLDIGPAFSSAEQAKLVLPADLPRLHAAAVNAILKGLGAEVGGEDEEIDEGLAELNKKKESPAPNT